jgi:hypothetical protein
VHCSAKSRIRDASLAAPPGECLGFEHPTHAVSIALGDMVCSPRRAIAFPEADAVCSPLWVRRRRRRNLLQEARPYGDRRDLWGIWPRCRRSVRISRAQLAGKRVGDHVRARRGFAIRLLDARPRGARHARWCIALGARVHRSGPQRIHAGTDR